MKTRDVKRRLRSLLGIVCLCVVFGGGVVVYANSAPTPPSGLYALPQPAVMPSFNLPTTNGDTLDSTALAGQVVIVRFWATW
ncbi:hypothetical protein C2W62_17115 [Candidatus Entotheonella serta]|nr:hypothetical protein C2W62_17115 [Candidatus Entotheonella serta]